MVIDGVRCLVFCCSGLIVVCCEVVCMFWNLSVLFWVLWFIGVDRICECWFLRIVVFVVGYFLVSIGGVSVLVFGVGIRSLKYVDK